MSKGPGKKQKIILDKAASGEWFYLIDLLPKNYTEKEYQSLYRAFRALLEKGLIQEIRFIYGNEKLLIGNIDLKSHQIDRADYKCLVVGINSTP